MSTPTPVSDPQPVEDGAHYVWIRVPSESLPPADLETKADGLNGVNGAHPTGARRVQEPVAEDVQDAQDAPDLRHLLSLLIRRRKIVIVTLLVVVALSTAFFWSRRPIYEATAFILVNSTTNSGATADLSKDLPILEDWIGSTQDRTVDTQVSILKHSDKIHKGALAQISTPQLRQTLDDYSMLDATDDQKTDVVSISTRSYSAEASKQYANAICQEYIQRSQLDNQSQVTHAADYVRDQLRKVRERVNTQRARVRAFKQQTGTFDLTEEAKGQLSQVGDLLGQLVQAQTDHAAGVAALQRMRSLLTGMPTSQISSVQIERNQVVDDLKSQLTKLELDRLNAQQEYTSTSPRIQNLDAQITALRGRLRQEAQTEIGSQQQTVNPIRMQTVQNITKVQADIWANDARSAALKSDLQRARLQLAKLPNMEYRLGQLTADLDALEQTYQMLNEKYQTLLISENGGGTNAQVLSEAGLPLSPVWPRKGLTLLLSIVVGIMLAIALATAVDRLDDRVHSEEDAVESTGVPVLTRVPFTRDEGQQSLLGNTSQTSPLLESYRMLRTNITFAALDDSIRSILVTSSQPNEGKSICSLNLAIALAMSGKQVIIVDCDLRRPSLHRLLNKSNDVGFTSVTAGLSTLTNALQETPVPGLRVLTSGPQPPNPTELLDSRAGRSCLQQVMEAADIVIIDTPPALVMADAQIVASIADAALLIISYREAGKREIARTAGLLAQTGTKLLGSILNKLIVGVDSYYSYYDMYNYRYYSHYIGQGDNPSSNGANGAAQSTNGDRSSDRADKDRR